MSEHIGHFRGTALTNRSLGGISAHQDFSMIPSCFHEISRDSFFFISVAMMSSSSSDQPGVLRMGDTIVGCGAENATEEQYKKWKVCRLSCDQSASS